jgi:hypothetical protein
MNSNLIGLSAEPHKAVASELPVREVDAELSPRAEAKCKQAA